jgi:hypothetical protein
MRFRRWMFRILGVLSLLWLFAPAAWAGDCSGPTDCGAARDNAPKAAGGAAIATAIGLALRGSNGNGDSEDAGADDRGEPPPKPKKKEDTGESVASTPSQALGGGGDTGGSPGTPGGSSGRPDPGALGE